ncbi:hypothetical protein [Tardiphaga sp.]|uniref:hypothetical protein n=1 Tax=Tardiphaga sp. TaxID=1926292 RepID=UPI00262AEAC4|nr:hypothetical protein [Tardiphaga sp.]
MIGDKEPVTLLSRQWEAMVIKRTPSSVEPEFDIEVLLGAINPILNEMTIEHIRELVREIEAQTVKSTH